MIQMAVKLAKETFIRSIITVISIQILMHKKKRLIMTGFNHIKMNQVSIDKKERLNLIF